jgi:hypothetical protein
MSIGLIGVTVISGALTHAALYSIGYVRGGQDAQPRDHRPENSRCAT